MPSKTLFVKRALPALLFCAACADSTGAPPEASVRYYADGPLCASDRVAVQLSIDNTVVGLDTFVVTRGPGGHITSKAFTVTTGPHIVGARIAAPGSTFVWPDRNATLSAGQSFTDTLSVYCS